MFKLHAARLHMQPECVTDSHLVNMRNLTYEKYTCILKMEQTDAHITDTFWNTQDISYLQEFPEEFPKFPSGCHDVDISIFHRTTCSMSTTNINDRINFKLFLQNMIHVYIQLLPTYSFSFLSFRHRPGWRDRICTKPSHTTGMLIRAALIMQSKVPPKRR